MDTATGLHRPDISSLKYCTQWGLLGWRVGWTISQIPMDARFRTGVEIMIRQSAMLAAAAALAVATTAANAQEKLKIGILTTLSGPPAVLGQQQRNGFQLAVKTLGGKLGGREVELIVQDDELKPDVAVSKAQGLVERDKVDFVVGPIFSNILGSILKPVTDSGTILISPNAGTSSFAGKDCNANLFVTSYQNDQIHEVEGKYAEDNGLKKVFLIAPNYQAGKDSMNGFKHSFKGQIVDEVYVPLNQLDYSAELAKISAAAPDAIFAFLPGGMGVNFVKQFRQAGLADKIKFLSAFTVDESTLPAQQDAAIGFFGGSNWAPNLDNPQNKEFVAAYEKEYGAVPATYAFQAYDTALLIDSALKQTKGDTSNKDALRAALMKADFKSLRGPFKFNTNHYPIQDFYHVKVAKRPDGKFQTEIVEKVFSNYGDSYAKDCPMK
jgi:branched-chain amino acid transport system substrate-binding protein